MFTGDAGRPGLPGLPGTYTVQIPHRVQKRDAGNMITKTSIHITNVQCDIHITHQYLIFPSTAGGKVVSRRQKTRRQANGG